MNHLTQTTRLGHTVRRAKSCSPNACTQWVSTAVYLSQWVSTAQCTYHSGSVQHSALITVGQYSTVHLSQWVSTAQCTYHSGSVQHNKNPIQSKLSCILLNFKMSKQSWLDLSFGLLLLSPSIINSYITVECTLIIIQFITCVHLMYIFFHSPSQTTFR